MASVISFEKFFIFSPALLSLLALAFQSHMHVIVLEIVPQSLDGLEIAQSPPLGLKPLPRVAAGPGRLQQRSRLPCRRTASSVLASLLCPLPLGHSSRRSGAEETPDVRRTRPLTSPRKPGDTAEP